MADLTSPTFSPQTSTMFGEGFDISSVLKDRNRQIQSSIAGFTNQTINPIKSTVSDLKSGIALIKDTDKQILNKLNTYKSATIDTINDYLGSLTGGKISIADFGRVVSIKDGFKIDSDELVRMAGQTLGFNISSISSMKGELTNQFLDELNDMTLGLSNGLFQVNGDKVTIAGDWDKSIGDSVFDFLSSGSSDFKTVRNFSAANAVLNTMVMQNAYIGFVEGYGGFASMYLYESDYFAALIATIPTLLARGDVDSLDEILKILDDTSRYTVKTKYSNFVELVLANFTLPETALPENYEGYKNKLLSIIVKIDGPKWMYKTTFLGDLLNMGLVSNISDSSKLVLQRDPALIPLLCCSGMIDQESSLDLFKRDFPNAVTF